MAQLSEFWHTPVRKLSLGQCVRCGLAASMLHYTMVIFLDEPTIGMDAPTTEQVRVFLREQAEGQGRTIILTTHKTT